MSVQIVVSKLAEWDLGRQFAWYCEHADSAIAEKYLTAFRTSTNALSVQPGLGRPRFFRAKQLAGMRSVALPAPFSAHLVFYRDGGERLTIERVIHGARDLDRRLLDPPKSA